MTALSQLWLPILLSAVIVFVASSIIHMVLPWHKDDYPRVANEDAVMDAMRPLGLAPGDYMVPRPASRDDLRSEAFKAKIARGPVVVMTVLPNGPFNMGAQMLQWFVFLVVVAIFSAYVTGHALAPGAPYLEVFRFVGSVAFLAFAAALWEMRIWYRRGWGLTIKATIDGLIYGLLMAGTFGWLWPK
jgi:hypothetical protein